MFKSSPWIIAPQDVQPFSFSFIVPYFSLVLFKGNRKTAHKRVYFKKCTLGCNEGALSGCTEAEPLRTRWYVLSKTKTCRIIIEVFHFYAICFILPLLLRKFIKTVREILYVLTLYPKLVFRAALKKAFMVSEDRPYQTQYFAKIFLSPLASTLHIYFYLHLKESSENAPWIAIGLKSAILSPPESALETALEITCFLLFVKNLTKKCGEKGDDRVCFDRIHQFNTYLFSCSLRLLLLGKFPSIAWLKKKFFYKVALLFFFLKTLCLKQIVRMC